LLASVLSSTKLLVELLKININNAFVLNRMHQVVVVEFAFVKKQNVNYYKNGKQH